MHSAERMIREFARTPYRTGGRQTERRGPSSRWPADLTSSRPCRQPDRPESVDTDAIDELGDEIATLSAHIHAATHRLLVLIAEFDRVRGWELAGYCNCARWLAARTGIDLGAAREKVRAARALESLPMTSAAMARGELSFSQVRALSRAADAESEPQLLELARGTTTAQLERVVRAWKKGRHADEAAWEREQHRARTFSVFPDHDGMYVVTGRLTPEVGALLMRAIEAASDALFRAPRVPGEVDDSDRAAAERRADAVGLLAERALAAGFGGPETGRPATDMPISGTHAQRYQVVLHVDAETLSGHEQAGSSELRDATGVDAKTPSFHERLVDSAPNDGMRGAAATLSDDRQVDRCELEDGTRVSAETSRRIACDSGVVRVVHEKDGSVLDVGRKTRTISPALRRALEARDRGCRFPGCHLRFCDAHHVVHWARGGATSLSNCLLLCKFHHMLVHERGWRVQWWGKGRPVFFDPRGNAHFDGRWKPPALPEQPVAALIRQNERGGIEPDAWTAGARWEREQAIPDRVYFPALEAV